MAQPDFSFETKAHRRGLNIVAGVDEVGRGPLAGPVVAAAVVLDPKNIPDGLNDSKKLSAKRRADLCEKIFKNASVSIAQATVDEIDTHNILRASHIAMLRAIEGLSETPDHVLIDGNLVPRGLSISNEAIVKGDSRSQSVAAASIIAKLWRDRHMVDLAQQFPHYGWEKNMGYGTAQHFKGLGTHGITHHHRRSFKPIHNILYQEKNVSN
ncbi:MAG: ribonuclease HII [Pseudomonadota bacterium]